MDQLSIKELVDAVIGELRRLGYKKSTIHSYDKICADSSDTLMSSTGQSTPLNWVRNI